MPITPSGAVWSVFKYPGRQHVVTRVVGGGTVHHHEVSSCGENTSDVGVPAIVGTIITEQIGCSWRTLASDIDGAVEVGTEDQLDVRGRAELEPVDRVGASSERMHNAWAKSNT